jgi:hypothetical protein
MISQYKAITRTLKVVFGANRRRPEFYKTLYAQLLPDYKKK